MGFLLHGFCPRFLSSPACNLPAPCLHPTGMLPSLCRCAACTYLISTCVSQALCLLPVLYLLSACTLLALCLHTARVLPVLCVAACGGKAAGLCGLPAGTKGSKALPVLQLLVLAQGLLPVGL